MTTWHTVADAAVHIRVKDDRIIRHAIHTGELPACRPGKSYLIDEADLDAWVRSQPWEPKA